MENLRYWFPSKGQNTTMAHNERRTGRSDSTGQRVVFADAKQKQIGGPRIARPILRIYEEQCAIPRIELNTLVTI
jgi:hypothetical protein